MSHSYGRVFALSDKRLLGHFEYNGTSDCACTAIFATEEELTAAWRSDAIHRDCECADPNICDVWLESDYGVGVEFASKACLRCMSIVMAREPSDERG